MSYGSSSTKISRFTTQNTMSFKFEIGDDVKVIDVFSNKYGKIGTVINRTFGSSGVPEYTLDFPDIIVLMYFKEGDLSIYTSASMKMGWGNVPPQSPAWDIVADKPWVHSTSSLRRCNHSWKEDFQNPFSPTKYYSCRACGKKKEEYEKESSNDDFGVPF